MAIPEQYIHDQLAAHSNVLEHLRKSLQPALLASARMMTTSLLSGGKILLFGNGGSACDAQHFAAELVGRFAQPRGALPALALTTDGAVISALANDLGYEHVFERQIEAFAKPRDVAVAISTSGSSPNVRLAAERAKELGCSVIGWLGSGGGSIASLCDLALVVPSKDVPRVQEMHSLIAHLTCGLVERAIVEAASEQPGPPRAMATEYASAEELA